MDTQNISLALVSMECLKEFCKNNKCTKCIFYDDKEEMNCILQAPYSWGDFNYDKFNEEVDNVKDNNN